jgi:hypothetical protein
MCENNSIFIKKARIIKVQGFETSLFLNSKNHFYYQFKSLL